LLVIHDADQRFASRDMDPSFVEWAQLAVILAGFIGLLTIYRY
jgi:hypothetical protein